jgi:hypothetical protein
MGVDSNKTSSVVDDTATAQERLQHEKSGTILGEEVDFSGVDEKKTLRKMDIRLIPMLALLYLLSFLDRSNIGNAKIQGMVVDLRLSADGSQYNIALTV